MFVNLPVSSGVEIGHVVAYDKENELWSPATSSTDLIGVVSGSVEVVEGVSRAPVTFAGLAWARASREIPQEGGLMEIESGGVYASPDSRFGVIAPATEPSASRSAGGLVMITL